MCDAVDVIGAGVQGAKDVVAMVADCSDGGLYDVALSSVQSDRRMSEMLLFEVL